MFFKEAVLGKSKTSLAKICSFFRPLGPAWPPGAVVWLWNTNGKQSEHIMGHLYFGGMVHLGASFGDAAQERLSWEAAGFGVGMVWWMSSYYYPPAVEMCFCERQGVLSIRKGCCSTRRWGLCPWCSCSHALSLHWGDQSQAGMWIPCCVWP